MQLLLGLAILLACGLLVGWVAAAAWVWDELSWGGNRRRQARLKLLSPFIVLLAPVLCLCMTVPGLLRDAFGKKTR